jgi:hypothetical protein
MAISNNCQYLFTADRSGALIKWQFGPSEFKRVFEFGQIAKTEIQTLGLTQDDRFLLTLDAAGKIKGFGLGDGPTEMHKPIFDSASDVALTSKPEKIVLGSNCRDFFVTTDTSELISFEICSGQAQTIKTRTNFGISPT